MNKKDKQALKDAERKLAICPYCQLDCITKDDLQRHIDWAHKDKK